LPLPTAFNYYNHTYHLHSGIGRRTGTSTTRTDSSTMLYDSSVSPA
jgi:hypothetical protein